MIIYGTKARQVAKELVVEKCPNCGSLNSVDIYVFQKYAHVFWIPFFPTGKTGVSQCNHCKQTLKLKEMPDSLRSAYDRLKAQSKTPVWTFSFLAIIIVLIIIGAITSKNNDAKNKKYIESPRVNDVYEVRESAGVYTLYRVHEVTNDSIFIFTNQYTVNSASGFYKISSKGLEAYDTIPVGFSRSDLKDMLGKGDILNVARKE